MATCYEIGDKIKGYRILCEARQIKPPKVIPKMEDTKHNEQY